MKWLPVRKVILPALLLVAACSETTTIVGQDFVLLEDLETADRGEPDTRVIIGPQDIVHGDDLDSAPGDSDGAGADVEIDDAKAPDLPDLTDGWDSPDLPDIEDVHPDEVTDLPPDVPDVPDIQEVKPDNGCTPECGSKVCGFDGCDGVCGYCAYGELCNPQGQCVKDICPTQCTTTVDGEEVPKECGPDGCGGYCGYCTDEGMECKADGFCHSSSCVPDCDGKECGDDGCGNPCGFCQAGMMCGDEQSCVPHPCGTVTYKGQCEDKYNLVECVDLALAPTNCKSQPDMMCGWDENVGKYACVQETACAPQCLFEDGTPKECGPDGCWSSCGSCPKGWGCGSGRCMPAIGAECAWIDGTVGACVGDVRWFCSPDKLNAYDCQLKEGTTCGWDPTANFGLGGYDCL